MFPEAVLAKAAYRNFEKLNLFIYLFIIKRLRFNIAANGEISKSTPPTVIILFQSNFVWLFPVTVLTKVHCFFKKRLKVSLTWVKEMNINKLAPLKKPYNILHISNMAIRYETWLDVIWQVVKHHKEGDKAHVPLIVLFATLWRMFRLDERRLCKIIVINFANNVHVKCLLGILWHTKTQSFLVRVRWANFSAGDAESKSSDETVQLNIPW